MPDTALDILYLCACALHETAPDGDIVRSLDLAAVYRGASRHGVTALVCMALERSDAFGTLDETLRGRFTETKNKAIRKIILLDAEKKAICAFFEAEHIRYAPLKGSVLKDLYPRLGMREMADYDILYDESARDRACAFMLDRGYTRTETRHHHDAFEKPPVLNIELHTKLFNPINSDALVAYYRDPWARFVPDGRGGCGYRLSDEDFYVYMTAHAYKHYTSMGTGLRSLTDAYVFDTRRGGAIDRARVDRELAALGIADYERDTLALAGKLLAAPVRVRREELTDSEAAMLDYIYASGAFGVAEHLIANKAREMGADGAPLRGGRLGYIMRRVFPGAAFLRSYYPLADRHPILIPYFWFYRLYAAFRYTGKKTRSELRALRKRTPDE